MIWLTWRQFRTQAVVAVVILAAAVAALVVDARAIAQLWADSGAATCPATGACAALQTFSSATSAGTVRTLTVLGTALLYVAPPLIGLFWGAPMVAREVENGTQRLVWNQSVTRTRWLTTKLLVLGGGSMALTGALSAVVWWASRRLDVTVLSRIGPLLFGARGIVPVGYAAFAFTLGVVAGLVIRRTVGAMAATLAIYLAVVGVMTLGVRAALIPATHLIRPLSLDRIEAFGTSHNGDVMRVIAEPNLPGAWILHNRTLTSSGAEFTGPANPQVCGRDLPPKGCMDWVASLGLRQDVVYQPASHFWPLQWAEFGVFAALTALLVAAGFWWLRRRTA
jgi:hypothetical protein